MATCFPPLDMQLHNCADVLEKLPSVPVAHCCAQIRLSAAARIPTIVFLINIASQQSFSTCAAGRLHATGRLC